MVFSTKVIPGVNHSDLAMNQLQMQVLKALLQDSIICLMSFYLMIQLFSLIE